MAKTKTSSAVKNKYNSKTYDRINLFVSKGQKEVFQTHATNRNESLNAFVNRAMTETLERDNIAESASV